MPAATVIFPHQLFLDHPGLKEDNPVYLVEDPLFFHDPHYQIYFHKKKLMLHRASMKSYQDYLSHSGYEVLYLKYSDYSRIDHLFQVLKEDKVMEIYFCDPVDHSLEERLEKHSRKYHINLKPIETFSFINSRKDIKNYFKKSSRYHLTSFYIHMRKTLNILLEKDKPTGKHWTFDKYNRRRLPRNMKIPSLKTLKSGHYMAEAVEYVEEHFKSHPGSTDNFIYPVTHQESQEWLSDFIKNRLPYFGDYQDFIHKDEPFLFHSLLSSSLNLGLLTPLEVVQATLIPKNIPLNNREGFIRQLIGWREFLRAVYMREGTRQRTTNHFSHQNKMPPRVWKGETGLLPFDNTVKKVFKEAYAHHIERLMILGNLMLLLELDPDEVYRWFMTFFIDAYDWVMVPNVYGMSQYADGGLITTKPYLSSSNYILRMSNYPREEWTDTWNSLFWNFLYKHRDLVQKNPRLALLKGYLKDKDKMQKHRQEALEFMENLMNNNVMK
jgi:deoxyribodipyrimidine photolyase-related protein